jgi:integrase/recombinase XerD
MADCAITVYHDLRRAKDKDVYPVKIRVYFDYKTRYYPTGKDLTEDQFKRSYLSERPRGDLSDTKDKILFELSRAKEIAKELKTFSFDKFEKRFLRKSGSGNDIFYHFNQTIKQLKEEERIKTASGYDLAMKSLKAYLKTKERNINNLSFDSITVKFLNNYEKWMLSEGNSFTTIGIYLRNVRALFNFAIKEHEIDKEIYPFGKDRYIIPGGDNIKKALNKADLKKLYSYELPEESPMRKARAFWFFSYMANGMNIRDICELKQSNFNKDRFTFIRTKTKRTTKKKLRNIEVIVTEPLQKIIDEYGAKSKNPNQYVFPVFDNSMTAEEKVKACEKFTRFINQHIKKLAKLVDIDEDISTYYARHSMATISVHNGSSLEFVQEALGHGSITTTQNYFAGFNDAKKKELATNLTSFIDE